MSPVKSFSKYPTGNDGQDKDVESDPLGFEWVFKPVFLWIRLTTGIKVLSPSETNRNLSGFFGTCLSLLESIFAFIMLVVTISLSILSIFYMLSTTSVQTVQGEDNNLTRATVMIVYITAINDSVESFSIYLVFYAFVLMGKWDSLWFVVKLIERQHPKISRKCYLQCRKIAIVGLLSILINVGLNLNFGIRFVKLENYFVTLIGGISVVLETIATSIGIFFCVINWAAVHLLRCLNSQMDEFSKKPLADMSPNWMAIYLENWRRKHTLVCQLIDEIKSFFGLILLISVAHAFVSLITDSFEVLVAFQRGDSLGHTFVIRLIQHLVLFAFICYGSDLVQAEGSNTVKILRQINVCSVSSQLQHQLNGILIEISQTNFKITAADFFEVNLGLFPTLIGTTLTYLIILMQQASSVKM